MKKDAVITKFERVLDEYLLTKKLPAEAQRRMLSSKPEIYERVIKSAGKAGLITALLIPIYFFFKKNTSLFTLKLILMLSVSTGLPLLYHYYYAEPLDNKAVSCLPAELITTSKREKDTSSEVRVPLIAYTVAIHPFTSSSLDGKNLLAIEDKFLQELSAIRGPEFSSRFRKNSRYRYSLFVSIENSGSSFSLNARLVDNSTSSIEMVINEKTSSLKKLLLSIPDISKKISSKISE